VQVKSVWKYSRVSPTKVRRILNLVRGNRAEDALVKLRFMPHDAARRVEKVLKAALANAESLEVAEPEEMRIVHAVADPGPTMRRMMPRAMGRGSVIRKRTSHITVVLADE